MQIINVFLLGLPIIVGIISIILFFQQVPNNFKPKDIRKNTSTRKELKKSTNNKLENIAYLRKYTGAGFDRNQKEIIKKEIQRNMNS